MKQVLFGLLWALVFYVSGTVLVGAAIGFQVGLRNPHAPPGEGARVAAAWFPAMRPYLLGGAIALAIFGAGTGILPGTKRARKGQPRTSGYDMTQDACAFPINPVMRDPEERKRLQRKTMQAWGYGMSMAGFVVSQVLVSKLAPRWFPHRPGVVIDFNQVLFAGLVGGTCGAIGGGLGALIGILIDSFRE